MIDFRLLLITDWSLPDCLERVLDAVSAGPGIAVQHRHHGVDDRTFFREGETLAEALGSVPLFVNGRLEIALALNAHLHLHRHALPAAEVRPRLPGKVVSASWHWPAPAPADVDLLLVSPVFEPTSKPAHDEPLGAERFRALRADVPIFALGGLTPDRARTLGPSLAGVAVIGSVLHAPSPALAARHLLDALP